MILIDTEQVKGQTESSNDLQYIVLTSSKIQVGCMRSPSALTGDHNHRDRHVRQ